MATVLLRSNPKKKFLIFLNISFLLLVCFLVNTCFYSSEILLQSSSYSASNDCRKLQDLEDNNAKCLYLTNSNSRCVSKGYVDYIYLFYCIFGGWPFLGYFLSLLFLLVLFYLLGNTASEYFCSSLENLSKLLKLSPTIAGVTLLSLGNGAPDIFSSIVSFMGSRESAIGINTVLGGASFVSCVVFGTISIVMHSRSVKVRRSDFMRDGCFFLVVVLSLALVLINGKISMWGSIGFLSAYVIFVLVVYVSHVCWKRFDDDNEVDVNSTFGNELGIPILRAIEKDELVCIERGSQEGQLVIISNSSTFCNMCLLMLEMPLYLPRRLTIPVVCEKRYSRPFAVASATLAPLLLAAVWNSRGENENTRIAIYLVGLSLGIAFGVSAFFTTEKSNPPKKCLLPWLVGGFLMSVTWSYIIAQELVGLLVSLGYISGISPSILGLTVLAWGNSLGDLITNVTMAINGGPEGAQIAVSGCYAGPIFNILIGLGLSLLCSTWNVYPSPFVISNDPQLLETLGFMVFGLIWALLLLPRRGMRLDWVLGAGLLTIYFLGIALRLLQTLGNLQLHHHVSSL
ncbi:Sodium/calcium exchanger membrane region [Dillenia turbinata]|uniref:Sodium/calcium exchanger membrane region n=1 Tax=Dillenia turbinata TaxID=194707 RepID=A0AAN8W3C4_9MAGN